MKNIIIDEQIFETFPDFMRGIIIVTDIDNSQTSKRIEELLTSEAKSKVGKEQSNSVEVLAWDEIHRKFGSNPNKFPPSIKNLLKRIEKDFVPPYINSAVALFNYISLKYLVPCGGDDIERVEGNLHLGFATGSEHFSGLGSEEVEAPVPGEVIYYDDATQNIMCRKWNWRNGDFTKIQPSTKRIVINIDGISPVSESTITEARDQLEELLKSECKAQVSTDFLKKDKRTIELPF